MTRDFKQSETETSSSQYGISWVLGGVAVGLLAGAVVYALMSKQNTALPLQAQATTPPSETAEKSTSTPAPSPTTSVAKKEIAPTLQDKPAKDNRPGFSYHAVLPQLELGVPIASPQEVAPAGTEPPPAPVIIPPIAERRPTAPSAPAPAQQPLAQGRYMFQLGAYRNRNQAIQLQQRAKQNGMNTRVEPAKINNQTWYRVRLGPTDNIQVVNRWKQRLSSMGINPMMIRL